MAIDRRESVATLLMASSRIIRESGLRTGYPQSSAVWTALSVLESAGPHRVGDLARAVRVSQPGMTKVVHGLAADEWVRRIADTESARAWLIVITDRGRAALADYRRALVEATSTAFAGLTEAQWRTLDEAARILRSRLNGTDPLTGQNRKDTIA
ncbi:MAG: MarR family transcriptional regulator [Microbacteriaceae bacterium]